MSHIFQITRIFASFIILIGGFFPGFFSDMKGHAQAQLLKTIIVDDYFPYTFVNEQGTPDGFSVDLIKAVAQTMGFELEIRVDTWQHAVEALQSGEIDFLPMMAYSEERDLVFDFSSPHTIAFDAFFTRKDTPVINSMDDLRGKMIIVMENDQAHNYISLLDFITPEQLILVDSLPDALRLLASGKGDAALMPKLVGLLLIQNLNLKNLEQAPIVVEAYNRPFSFAVKNGNQALLERLSQGLEITAATGEYKAIHNKWFSSVEPVGIPTRTVLAYFGGILLVGLLIGSFLLAWSFSLRKQVAQRTSHLEAEIQEHKQSEEARQHLQVQLVQAQKMESVGRLAGGVAHDFNNMLGVILGHVELALDRMDDRHKLQADLEEIQRAAERSADLTRQLLAFARKQTIAPKILDLNLAVTGMLKMLRRLIGEDIDLVWNPGTELLHIKMDPSQIDQLLVNLCTNARDAINGVGKVIIETSNVVFGESYKSAYLDFLPGEYVMLAVSDNGCGMNKETLSHVFEPFFTTKDMGQGTGLGLATVYGIVKQNQGFVDIYSEPDQGTTVKVYLPRFEAGTEGPKLSKMPGQVSLGHETLLVVEDEPAMLELMKEMLESLGYRVLDAGTPGQAIQMAQEFQGEIHLLMTDVVMPEMNGRDLAHQLNTAYPHLKQLFMSGYTADIIAHRGVLDEGVQFIQKPFKIDDLAAKIREVLDKVV